MTPNAKLIIHATDKKFIVKDSTPADQFNFPLVDAVIRGIGKIKDADGVVLIDKSSYASSFLTANPGSDVLSAEYNTPTDDQGQVPQGNYTLEYGFAISSAGSLSIGAAEAGNKYRIVGKDFTQVLIVGATFTTSGYTTPANNGTKTIVSSVLDGADTLVTVSEAVTAETVPGTLFTFQTTIPALDTNSYVYLCNMNVASASFEYDCDYGTNGRLFIKNTSNMGEHTITSRLFQVYYPQGLTNPVPTPDPYTASDVNGVTITKLATGPWVYKMTIGAEYVQDDDLIVQYDAVANKTEIVTCTGFLCGIRCCIDHIIGLKESMYKTANVDVSVYNTLLTNITQLYMAADMARRCGNKSMVTTYVNKIQSLIDNSGFCSDDCGCNDNDAPQWVDNSGGETQDLINELYEIVGGLQTAVSTDTAATAAFNNIMVLINAYNTMLDQLQSSISAIQSSAIGLNPSSPTFDDDVDALEAQAALLPAQLTAINNQLTAIQSMIYGDFVLQFPQYTNFTDTMVAYLDSSFSLVTSVNADIVSLQSGLAAMTSNDYPTQIAAILALISDLYSGYSDLQSELNNINNTLVDVQVTIGNIQDWLASLQLSVDTILNTFNESKVQPLTAEVAVEGITIWIPNQFVRKGGYFKVIVAGYDPTGVTTNIFIKNNLGGTPYTIHSAAVANKQYELVMIVMPDLTTDPFTFKKGGHIDTNSDTTTFAATGINGSTEIIYDEYLELKIESDSVTNEFKHIEVLGYDLTY